MRVGKEFSECGTKLKVGDKLKAEVVLSWNAERGVYRNELVHLGECPVKLDRQRRGQLPNGGSLLRVESQRCRGRGALRARPQRSAVGGLPVAATQLKRGSCQSSVVSCQLESERLRCRRPAPSRRPWPRGTT